MAKLLDLFCGAGGCSTGYARAGFDVTGVDIAKQPDYPSGFKFVHADAMKISPDVLKEYDVIHASPPCQAYSCSTSPWLYTQGISAKSVAGVLLRSGRSPLEIKGMMEKYGWVVPDNINECLETKQPRWGGDHDYPDLIGVVRELLVKSGRPYVIENVPNSPLNKPITLCGTMFGLKVLRHRWFESSMKLKAPCPCKHKGSVKGGQYYTVAGGGGSKEDYKKWCVAMGIDWMSKASLVEAIPPAYTECIGRQIMMIINDAAAGL